MPKLKLGHISPTPEEDAQIQRGIDADPDTYFLTDEEWERVKPDIRIGFPSDSTTDNLLEKKEPS